MPCQGNHHHRPAAVGHSSSLPFASAAWMAVIVIRWVICVFEHVRHSRAEAFASAVRGCG